MSEMTREAAVREFSAIEDAIAANELTAPAVFTKMRQIALAALRQQAVGLPEPHGYITDAGTFVTPDCYLASAGLVHSCLPVYTAEQMRALKASWAEPAEEIETACYGEPLRQQAGQAEPVALTDRQLHIAACKIYAAASADSATMLAVIRSLGFKDGEHFGVVND